MIEETQGFAALGIAQPILKALDDMGFEEPTPIQSATIALLLEGKDVVGQAQTGTGKTAAFAVPLLQRLEHENGSPQALVLTPTRELALQVTDEIAKIGRYLRVRELAVCGGHPIERQIRALRSGVSVVVGTPGRVIDLIERRALNLDGIKMVVLDEADEMLDMGFIEDIEKILSYIPKERQTVCFSAVIPEPIAHITRKYMVSPVRVNVQQKVVTAPTIEQYYFEIRDKDKLEALTRIIDHDAISRAIIFCRTKKGCDELSSALQARGYLAEAIHGDLNQVQRNRTLARFKEGQIELLIATDVAARGLDVENVTHVINYDIPDAPETYVHRIGRTGRAGREGKAFTLIHPREYRHLKLIERTTKARIPRRRIPTAQDVAERALELLAERIAAKVSSDERPDPKYLDMASRLLEEHDPERLVAALVSSLADLRATGDAQDNGTNGKRSSSSDGSVFDLNASDTGAEPGYVRLFMNIGAKHRVTPGQFVRTIAEKADIPGAVIGAIDIHDDFTFVEVPRDVARDVLSALKHVSMQGREVQTEPARPR